MSTGLHIYDQRDIALEVTTEVDLVHQLAGDATVIFDVGAYHCTHSKEYEATFHHAQVYAFEADYRNYLACMMHTKDHPRISPFFLALNSYSGECTFYSSFRTKGHETPFLRRGSGSILEPRREKLADLWDGSVDFDTGKSVVCLTLTDLCKIMSIDHIDVLHIDVQGAEKEVLQGLGDHRPRVMICETGESEAAAYHGAHAIADLDAMLHSMGYSHAIRFRDDTVYVRGDIPFDLR